MNFKTFLLEGLTPQSAADLINYKCQSYLREVGFDPKSPMNTSLKRALSNQPDVKFEKLKTQRGRAPSNSSPAVHDAMDFYLHETFGFYGRSDSNFTMGTIPPGHYGDPFYMFPIGEFKYAWSKFIQDAFQYFDAAGTPEGLAYIEKILKEPAPLVNGNQKLVATKSTEWGKMVRKFLDKEGKMLYTNTGLADAVRNYPRNEVMVDCREYYILSTSGRADFTKQVLDLLAR